MTEREKILWNPQAENRPKLVTHLASTGSWEPLLEHFDWPCNGAKRMGLSS